MKRKRLEDYVTVEREPWSYYSVRIAGKHIWRYGSSDNALCHSPAELAHAMAQNIKRGLRAAQKEMERANDDGSSKG